MYWEAWYFSRNISLQMCMRDRSNDPLGRRHLEKANFFLYIFLLGFNLPTYSSSIHFLTLILEDTFLLLLSSIYISFSCWAPILAVDLSSIFYFFSMFSLVEFILLASLFTLEMTPPNTNLVLFHLFCVPACVSNCHIN